MYVSQFNGATGWQRKFLDLLWWSPRVNQTVRAACQPDCAPQRPREGWRVMSCFRHHLAGADGPEGAQGVVFEDSMFLLGGFSPINKTCYNDVWVYADSPVKQEYYGSVAMPLTRVARSPVMNANCTC